MKKLRLWTPSGIHSYLECGSGQPLMLIHGLPLDARTFTPLAEPLSRHFRVIVPDLLGFGDSEMPRVRDFTLERLAVGLLEFVRSLRCGTPAVVGHSMGGYVALEMFRSGSSALGQLMLLSSQSSVDLPQKRSNRERFATELERGEFARFIQDQVASCLTHSEHQNRFLREVITQNVTLRLSELLRSIAARTTYDDVLARYGGNISFLAGSEDSTRVAEMVRVQRKFPKIRTVPIDGGGHMLPLEVPHECAEVIARIGGVGKCEFQRMVA